jgi:hypothetical protein
MRRDLPRTPAVSTSQTRARRQHTLDEEVDVADYEDEVLVGVGTRPQLGAFLAHGGKGGIPVYMGVGYVQGAEDVARDPERPPEVEKRTSMKTRNGGKRAARR